MHALGVIAYLGLTGRLPRPAGSVTEIVAASVRRVEPVSALVPGLGRAFDEGIARALAGDPSQRPTATDLGATLEAALERWRAGAATVAGDDATTLTDVPLPGRGVATEDPAITPNRDGRMLAVVGMLVAALLLGLAAFLLLGSDGWDRRTSPSVAGGGTSPSASASAPPTAAPTSSPAPSPTPTAALDPYGNARAASDEMLAAIAAAQGPGGLNGREAKDLESLLDRFDRALDKHDPKAARDEATKLAGQVAKLIDKRAVDAEAADRLQTASDRLVAAANALPD